MMVRGISARPAGTHRLFEAYPWRLALRDLLVARTGRGISPCIQLLVMLAQIGVKRFRTGLSQQCLEHHVPAPALRKMLAIGFSQRLDAGVAVLLVDAAGRIAMPSVQAFLALLGLLGFLGHLILPEVLNLRLNPTTVMKRRVVGCGDRLPRDRSGVLADQRHDWSSPQPLRNRTI